MAANDYSFLNNRKAVENQDMPAYEKPVWPGKDDPVPDNWFDAGLRRRINQFRRELPA